MSIERISHTLRAIECDTPRCNTTTDEWDRDDFREMVADAQTRGWHVCQRNGSWHYCPEHAAAERRFDQGRAGARQITDEDAQERAEAQAAAYLRR